jgi:hypothetical protein
MPAAALVALTAMLAGAGSAAAAFQPSLAVSSANPVAGAFSPFTLRVDRPDGQPHLAGLTVELPPLAGTVSLTGPYRDAPFGLSIPLRPLSGTPGAANAVVRAAIFIDPEDAHLRVVSDPFPASAAGSPVRVRSVELAVDRAGFMFNPTSCAAQQVRASVTASDGSSASAVAGLQFGGCSSLPFRPRLRLRLEGRRETRDGGHPRVRAVLTPRRGDANLRRVEVRLPLTLALDLRNANSLCSFEAGQAGRCPRRAIIGRASARTALLTKPLVGRIYLVEGRRTTPDGQQVR